MNIPTTEDIGLNTVPPIEATGSDASHPGRHPDTGIHPVELHPRHDRRVSWEWNIPLLVKTLVIFVVAASAVFGIYFWQSKRLSNSLLTKSQEAAASGDSKTQLKWLSRYIQLAPNDIPALIQLALLEDSLVSTSGELDSARRRLTLALASCEDSFYDSEREELRAKLIGRLLQMGRLWAAEAENQVLELKATPRDPQVSKWLAQAILAQQTGNQFPQRDPDEYEADREYWEWFVTQPVGEVLLLALEANPDDLDLAASLIPAFTLQPELFNAPGKPADLAAVQQRVEVVVDRLKEKTAIGRAQLIAYAYLNAKSPPQAPQLILTAYDSAIARIETDFSEQTATPASATASTKEGEILDALASSTPLPDAADQANSIYWDWMLCLEACRVLQESNEVEQAKALYEKLLACDSELRNREQRETTYVRLGQLLQSMGDSAGGIPAAIDVWAAGSERITESLQLIGLLAMGYASEKNIDEAQKQIEEFERVIELQRKRLDGPLGISLTSAAKQAINQRLDTAAWESLILQCQVAMLTEDYRTATGFAERAFKDSRLISNEQRVQAGRMLAECYQQQQLWDMVGQVLDRCIALMPNNQDLRRSAANAWKNAGAADRATQQLETLDDGSFAAAIEIARLTAYGEASKPKQQADLFAVRKAIDEVRRRYEATPADQQSELEYWRFELLEVGFVAMSDTAAEVANLDSTESRLDRLEELAAQYPDVADVQMFAAANLAAEERAESADKCWQRLDELAAKSGLPVDYANALTTKAIAKASAGDSPAAIKLLEDALPTLKGEHLRVASDAANMALKAGSPQDAYRILKMVPPEKLDIEALMTLAGIVNISIVKQPQDAEKLLSELTQLTEQIKEMESTEGTKLTEESEGTHWRFVSAERKLNEYYVTSEPRLLDEASKLFREIDVRRPRWGRAAALGAQIESARGFSDDAIRLYRRAIRDGDNRVKTINGLVNELKVAGRIEQAQEELGRLRGLSEAVFPFSEMSISLALRSGDYLSALREAREATVQQPQAANKWRSLADTIMNTIQAPKSRRAKLDKPALIKEGWTALEKALELSSDNQLPIWEDRIRFRLATGGFDSAKSELLTFEKTIIPNEQSLLIAARWYLAIKDYEQSRDRADKALVLNPRSSLAHLLLAELHSQTANAQLSLEALRKAQAAAPTNRLLREQLAKVLAFSPMYGAEERDDRLKEIDKLLESTTDESSYSARLVKAYVELSTGTEQRQMRALATLREIASRPSEDGLDAKRVLANHFVAQWLEIRIPDRQSPEANRLLADASQLYRELTRSVNPSPFDLATYIDLLLKSTVVERNAGNENLANNNVLEATKLLEKLSAITGSSSATLQLSIRLALAKDEKADIQPVVEAWIQSAKLDSDEDMEIRVTEVAGRTLTEMGLPQQALVWLKKVYEQDPSRAEAYIVGLANAKKINEAIAICVEAFRAAPSARIAALIPEVIAVHTDVTLSAEAEETIRSAMNQFEDSPVLLEAVATLRLMQERYPEAVGLFQRIEKKTVERVRTLNNLAIALAELPMGKNEALIKIDRAIEIQGKIPELLDTRGIVLLRLNRFAEARQDFEQAIKNSDDVRFKIHLAQAALAQKDLATVTATWAQIDSNSLNDMVLTSNEREFVQQMKQQSQPKPQEKL